MICLTLQQFQLRAILSTKKLVSENLRILLFTLTPCVYPLALENSILIEIFEALLRLDLLKIAPYHIAHLSF